MFNRKFVSNFLKVILLLVFAKADSQTYFETNNSILKVANERVTNTQEEDSFLRRILQCDTEDRYPNPINCEQYIQCAPASPDINHIGFIVQCPLGTRYNIETKQCSINVKHCYQIQHACSLENNKIIAFKPYPRFYAYCPNRNDTTSRIVLRRCEYSNYIFIEEAGNCKPKCEDYGNVASAKNNRTYFGCYKNENSEWEASIHFCPLKYDFNPESKVCNLPSETIR